MKNEKGSRNLEIAKSRMFEVSLFSFWEQIFLLNVVVSFYSGEPDRAGVEGEVGVDFLFRVTYWQQDKLTLTQRNV